MVMIASFFVVVEAWYTVANLRTIDTREGIEATLEGAPDWLTVESMLELRHGVALVAAAGAVLAGGLAWQAMQGSRASRAVLSVVAVALFVCGLVMEGLTSAVVAAATMILWLSPSREWFNGEPPPEVKPLRVTASPPSSTASSSDASNSTGSTSGASPSVPTSSEPTAQQSGWGVPPSPAQQPPPGLVSTGVRPPAVTTAVVLTLVSATVMTAMLVLRLLVGVDYAEMVEQSRRTFPQLTTEGVTAELMRASAYLVVAIGAVWSLVAAWLAVQTLRRRAWAARALAVCAAVSAPFGLFMAILPGVAAIVVVVLLRRPESRAWLQTGR